MLKDSCTENLMGLNNQPLENGKKIDNIKGLTSNVVKNAINDDLDFNRFYQLLYKDLSTSLEQNKWYKNISTGSIEILKQSYEIKHNANWNI